MIRPARATDYGAYARLFRELGIDDPTPTDERWQAELMPQTLIDDRDGVVTGYAHVQQFGVIGYVRQLVVAEHARRAGHGTQMMIAVAAALRSAGVREWHLNVKSDNTAATRLYEKLGMRPEHRSTALRISWESAETLPRADATVLPVAPEEDADIETALRLLVGQIAMTRRRERNVLRQLRDDRLAPVGFASFDPDFPGTRIFRVTSPALAWPLLQSLRPYARHADLALVIDDDEDLTQLLVDHGALVRLRLLHYSGDLPA